MVTENLLIELGTEELPPKALRKLAEAFAENFTQELTKAELAFERVEWFAAPRRLALKVHQLATTQHDKQVEKRGPAVSAAFVDGKPTQAAVGWARSNGIEVEQAERLVTDKGEWLIHRATIAGQATKQLIAGMTATALAGLPIPKLMRWGAERTQFVRPVHTLCLLLGGELVAGEVLGLQSARILRGHRFMGEAQFEIEHADQYPGLLEERGMVIADFARRKAFIKAGAEQAAAELGGIADIDDALLEEVTSLVEWPVILTASFEERFLEVPAEALVYTMKGDQKYFPVYDKSGNLMPNFIFVSNIDSKDPSQIIAGNERVVRPRLSDAEFFFKTDKKQPLAARLESLATVLFQQQLGTLKDKSVRIAELAAFIAPRIKADVEHATRAGLLSKCDLMTNMVMEFTDTQGVMGMHYARHDGEAEDVAVALNEQYMPRFAGDALPGGLVACAVAIADKLDSLVGIFGIGQAPKGDRDPFALRRAAIGTLRIVVEKQLDLDLVELVTKAAELYGSKISNGKVIDEVIDFMLARFRAAYQDEGIEVDVIQAVLARRPTRPVDFDKRVKAVSHFRTLDAAEALAAANKRVSNILAKFDGKLNASVENSLLQDPAEQALAAKVAELETQLAPLFAAGDYQSALTALASLRDVVDSFFDKVMVMAEDEALKLNRLTLLSRLRDLFLQIADISLLQK
ncbi:MAG: glycine--tRNA ligase subunit beta [Aeromonadaceae bacterium]